MNADCGRGGFSGRAAREGRAWRRERALEIATTLAMAPTLMPLDAPTQGMGPEDVERTRQLIQRVAADRTVLMVEHDMRVVASSADTIIGLQVCLSDKVGSRVTVIIGAVFVVCVVGFRRGFVGELIEWHRRRAHAADA